MITTDVLIVGAGPVGLTLALDLGRRGISCVLMEQKAEPAFLPKMERCNARTMEIYRRLGVVDKIRAAGLSGDVPLDVYIVLAMDQPPLLRLPYPSADEARRRDPARTARRSSRVRSRDRVPRFPAGQLHHRRCARGRRRTHGTHARLHAFVRRLRCGDPPVERRVSALDRRLAPVRLSIT